MNTGKNAVVLLSGGLDSATTLGIAHSQGYTCYALSFDYGQRHAREVKAAEMLGRHYQVQRHVTMKIDLRAFGGSALTADIAVPKDQVGTTQDIPITYVPARNLVFLSFAVGFAETVDARDIFLGVNAVDYSGYPDCRPEFIESFERTAGLGTKAGVQGVKFRVHAPLIAMTKSEIIRTGLQLKIPYEFTHSCYDPVGEKSCGHCDSCLIRLTGFKEAGAKDPVEYV